VLNLISASQLMSIVDLGVDCNGSGHVGMIIHGGGEVLYNKAHPLVKLLSTCGFCSRVFSLEMPFHGANLTADAVTRARSRPEASSAAEDLFEAIQSVVTQYKKVIFIG